MRTINASEFKAKCLAILDEVSETGEPLTILKHGKPVAQLVPAQTHRTPFPQDSLEGSVQILGDIISPTTDPDDWDANR
ncbi:MAG: type II toxin-antitoxin system Phd/YefM family antitoxin [Gemmatimonadetes bacterium]|nr:type II toxin-antitoxin system Phd/YefM family antitoxin [Gemmatimonadota bacterium]